VPITEKELACISNHSYLWEYLSHLLACMVIVHYFINLLPLSHVLAPTGPENKNANKKGKKDHCFQEVLFANNRVVLNKAQQRHTGVIFSLV